MLVDAGADVSSVVQITSKAGVVVRRDVPLGFALCGLYFKIVAEQEATEKQLQRLEGARRFLMRVEAVNAVSWLWISDVPHLPAAAAAEDARKSAVASAPLAAVLSILRRRAARRGMLLTALFRWVVGLTKAIFGRCLLRTWCFFIELG